MINWPDLNLPPINLWSVWNMPMKVESSPCINVCEMDSTSKICVGCGRTAYEIKHWIDYSPKQQEFRKKLAKERLEEHYETLFPE